MKLTFRNGIVRHQTDIVNSPTFLQLTGSGDVNLIVSPDPTIITFAQGTANYTFVENVTVNQAWGPFSGGDPTAWLFWDIDLRTGLRTFDFTNLEPIVSNDEPVAPGIDQHWFNKVQNAMFVFNGARFVQKIRVFSARLESGSVLFPFPIGSQVGIQNGSFRSGFILFDEDSKPVKKFQSFGLGEFIHTESELSSQFTKVANFKLEGLISEAEAVENIPKNFAVAYVGEGTPPETSGKIGLARNTEPCFPAVGIATEDMVPTEVRQFITQGFVKDDMFNFTGKEPGQPIFVGPTGELIFDVPQQDSVQRIGIVVDPQTILVDVKQILIYG
jgi:hypothetical protein